MNEDLHMAGELKGKSNLFVIFGEPDIDILDAEDGQEQVRVNGVDVFHPNSGEIRSDGPDGIACWFVDTDYNEESFFVRQAYFLGANDPYKALKTTLKAEINEETWETLHSDTSRPFEKPASGRIVLGRRGGSGNREPGCAAQGPPAMRRMPEATVNRPRPSRPRSPPLEAAQSGVGCSLPARPFGQASAATAHALELADHGSTA